MTFFSSHHLEGAGGRKTLKRQQLVVGRSGVLLRGRAVARTGASCGAAIPVMQPVVAVKHAGTHKAGEAAHTGLMVVIGLMTTCADRSALGRAVVIRGRCVGRRVRRGLSVTAASATEHVPHAKSA